MNISRLRPLGRTSRLAAFATLALVLTTTAGCVTVHSGDGGFLMGGRIDIEENEVSRDEIVMIGGSVRVDGEARREIFILGGSLTLNGTARDVIVVGGEARIGPDAHVRGDLVTVGASLNRSPGARIDGEVVNVGVAGLDFVPWAGMGNWSFGRWWGISPFHIVARTTQFLYWLVLTLLVVALAGDRVSSAAHSIVREPFRFGIIGFVGFFALCLLSVFLFIMSLLIIGIPFLMALILLWWLAYIFGMVAVFQVIGSKVLHIFGKRDASQIGLALTGSVTLSLLHYFPFIGTLFWVIAAFVGLGAVFATRFGTNRPWLGGTRPPVSSEARPAAPDTPAQAG
jgi:hypothetical protein